MLKINKMLLTIGISSIVSSGIGLFTGLNIRKKNKNKSNNIAGHICRAKVDDEISEIYIEIPPDTIGSAKNGDVISVDILDIKPKKIIDPRKYS